MIFDSGYLALVALRWLQQRADDDGWVSVAADDIRHDVLLSAGMTELRKRGRIHAPDPATKGTIRVQIVTTS